MSLPNTINNFDKRRTSRGTVLGRAQIQLNYDYQKSDFIVQLVEGNYTFYNLFNYFKIIFFSIITIITSIK